MTIYAYRNKASNAVAFYTDRHADDFGDSFEYLGAFRLSAGEPVVAAAVVPSGEPALDDAGPKVTG